MTKSHTEKPSSQDKPTNRTHYVTATTLKSKMSERNKQMSEENIYLEENSKYNKFVRSI